MIGDIQVLDPKYLVTANAILPYLSLNPMTKMCIGIGGESGSGKSVTALALAQKLNEKGFSTALLHQDDYFKFPPKTNHQKRVEDINWVGFQEVQLDLIQTHCQAFLNGEAYLQKPLVNYPENKIQSETVSLENVQILLVEGTYCLSLDIFDVRIFMSRNYKQTLQNRLSRGRDIIDDFTNQVLEIEHQLIAPLSLVSDIIIDENYNPVRK